MARISYDEQTAAAFKAVREVPRAGLSEWRDGGTTSPAPSGAATAGLGCRTTGGGGYPIG